MKNYSCTLFSLKSRFRLTTSSIFISNTVSEIIFTFSFNLLEKNVTLLPFNCFDSESFVRRLLSIIGVFNIITVMLRLIRANYRKFWRNEIASLIKQYLKNPTEFSFVPVDKML